MLCLLKSSARQETGKQELKSVAVLKKKKGRGIALTRRRELIIWSSMLVHGVPLMAARGELGADRWGCTPVFHTKDG